MSRDTDIIQFQPLTNWPGKATVERRGARFMRPGKFEEVSGLCPGSWTSVGRTITQLRRELEHFGSAERVDPAGLRTITNLRGRVGRARMPVSISLVLY